MTTYTTKQGDMWDEIAYRVYGACTYMCKLIYANPEYADVYTFPAGVELNVPELRSTDIDRSFVPPWRR